MVRLAAHVTSLDADSASSSSSSSTRTEIEWLSSDFLSLFVDRSRDEGRAEKELEPRERERGWR